MAVIRNGAECSAAGLFETLIGSRRIFRQVGGIGDKNKAYIEKLLSQQAGSFKRIAPVIAGARQHEYGLVALAGQLARPFSSGSTGTLHQRLLAVARFNQSQTRAEIEVSIH